MSGMEKSVDHSLLAVFAVVLSRIPESERIYDDEQRGEK